MQPSCLLCITAYKLALFNEAREQRDCLNSVGETIPVYLSWLLTRKLHMQPLKGRGYCVMDP